MSLSETLHLQLLNAWYWFNPGKRPDMTEKLLRLTKSLNPKKEKASNKKAKLTYYGEFNEIIFQL